MFICSLRASTLKFFGVVALAVLTLAVLTVFVPQYDAAAMAGGEVNYADIRTNEDRIRFLAQFGIEVEETPVEECEFTLPEEFDRVLAGYNEIQKQQGLDLSRYLKKNVTRYTYTVKNYKDYEGTVYVSIILSRDRVIAADIASADPHGFVAPLAAQE